jgi:hypothetical protein
MVAQKPSRWQKLKAHKNAIGVTLGLAATAGLVALGATTRRDIDEHEDSLYERAVMSNLD